LNSQDVKSVYEFKVMDSFIPSVPWHCWQDGRKDIWPVKNWVVWCWRGYLSA